MIEVAITLLVVSGVLFALRIARGSRVADRIVALDGLVTVILSGVAAYGALRRSTILFDVLVIVALLGFVGTSVVARFIERRGS
jgi:multisubunit Na+/H+ antiporter MnhF subunit